MHSGNAGPFQVLRWLGTNVELLDLPTDMQLRPIINVKYLTAYHGQLQKPLLQNQLLNYHQAWNLARRFKIFWMLRSSLLGVVATRNSLLSGNIVPCLIAPSSRPKKLNSLTPTYEWYIAMNSTKASLFLAWENWQGIILAINALFYAQPTQT